MWKKSFQQELSGEGTEFGYSASPIIADGRVYLPIGGPQASIVAIGLPDGNVAWKSGNGPASYCSMLPISRSGHPLLVGYLQNELVILDRTTGKELWKSRISGGYDEHSAMPIDFDPLVIVSAPFQAGSTAYRIEWHEGSANPLRVEQAWQQTQLSLDVDSATRIADVIFGFDLRDPQSKAHRPSRGTYRELDANTGEVLRRYRRVLIPEMNLGQLSMLIRAKFLVDAISYNQVRGLPFKAEELAGVIEDVMKSV